MNARQPVERRVNHRIREMLSEWADWQSDRCGLSFPSQVSFVQERVQNSGRGQFDHRVMPDDLAKLNCEIEKLAPGFRRIINLEYLDRRPQKAKAAELGIPREVFSARLRFIHEHLNHVMFVL